MKPVASAKAGLIYRGDQHEVGDLPCYREDGAVWSVWELTDDERRFIVDGGNIRVGIFHEPIPPIAVEVTGEQADGVNVWVDGKTGEWTDGREEAKP